MNNVNGANGDHGASFYSASSYGGNSDLDTTTVAPSSQRLNKMQTPRPPNDKLLHVSKCRNAKCPL